MCGGARGLWQLESRPCAEAAAGRPRRARPGARRDAPPATKAKQRPQGDELIQRKSIHRIIHRRTAPYNHTAEPHCHATCVCLYSSYSTYTVQPYSTYTVHHHTTPLSSEWALNEPYFASFKLARKFRRKRKFSRLRPPPSHSSS